MNHMTEREESLFDLKYLEDINRLFVSLKEIDSYYNTDIIQGDFNDLFDFIKLSVFIHEFNDDDDDENDNPFLF